MATRFLSVLAHAVPLSVVSAVGVEESAAVSSGANPIRKVVNLLQAMQKKVAEEGAKSEDLYQKYMCYCKSSGEELSSSVAAASTKVPMLEASITAASGKKAQLEGDLKSHQMDRGAAKKAMAEATAIREKEKAAFDKALAENKVNLVAAKKAAIAVDKGMAGSFLQTVEAKNLRAFVSGQQGILNADRQELLAFLSGKESSEYAPSSGEIAGILKQMADYMQKDQEELIATEEAAVKSYGGLMAAKKKELAALQKNIEEKLARVADVGVSLATMKNDREDTASALGQDSRFAADLKKNCAEKTRIHEEEKAMRAQETVALADTIKIINDDDALSLFKRTLPSAGASFVQVQASSLTLRTHARAALVEAKAHLKPGQRHRLDFILLALRGKKVGFDKVIKLIDELVATLKTEQQDDDHKKEYCEAQFDQTDDKKKGLERSISDLNTVIEESKEGIASLADEIKALKASIAGLDKAVAAATELRKAETAEHKELTASDSAAKELLLFAKNRLQKFYDPSLYKAAPERELSAGDRIYEDEGGDIPTLAPGGIANTGISAFVQLTSRRDAPAPPPETAAAYSKKSEESHGVIAMMDLLVQDLEKEMTEASVEEKNAKEEYEQTMADSAEKRREDSKALSDKEAAKADLESSLQQTKANKKSTARELMATTQYIAALKSDCDWLLEYFDVRKAARTDEIGALVNAKAVLSGADYSLVQLGAQARSRKFLRHA
jgi:hypothetical protein